ncbi:MAG: F0F1 ATP synthase subunit A [Solirubrobacteraceae bacterium]
MSDTNGEPGGGLSTKRKVFLGLGLYFALIVAAVFAFGKGMKNEAYKPHKEFKLDPWIDGPGPFDINKGILYVTLAALLTIIAMTYIAKRMEARPNRVQTAVEAIFALMRENISRGNMDRAMARKWFPFIGTIFMFIWFSNFIGYIPMPTNIEHKTTLLGVTFPSFALYAATANLSIPLVLALIVWISFNVEGIKARGFRGYLKSLIPPGVPKQLRGFIFGLEMMSNFMRLISLSVRLFANILAGHLIILFMSGALAVILATVAVGVVTLPLGIMIFIFEVGLVATLQAFIFATLTAIYLGEATAAEH